MFDNLLLVAIIIIIFWLGALAVYLYSSRQQRELQQDIESLRHLLDQDEAEERA